jgi:hypothetical protein
MDDLTVAVSFQLVPTLDLSEAEGNVAEQAGLKPRVALVHGEHRLLEAIQGLISSTTSSNRLTVERQARRSDTSCE